MAKCKIIEYRGVIYRRYDGRLYYNAPGGGNSLHRQVWSDANGEIPAGHDIHHRDRDHDNNRIENLECISRKEHARMHLKERLSGTLGEKLKRWRGSKKGKLTLKKNAKKMLARTPERAFTCSDCGVPVVTRHPTQIRCGTCTKAYDLRGGLVKPCATCGKPFKYKPHSYKEVRTCSYHCGWALRRKNSGL